MKKQRESRNEFMSTLGPGKNIQLGTGGVRGAEKLKFGPDSDQLMGALRHGKNFNS